MAVSQEKRGRVTDPAPFFFLSNGRIRITKISHFDQDLALRLVSIADVEAFSRAQVR